MQTIQQARRRSLQVAAPTVPQALKDLAKNCHFRKEEQNKAGREYEAGRKSLLGGMKDAGIKDFRTQIVLSNGGAATLEVAIGTPERNVVNPAKLIELVGLDKVMDILSVSKEKAEALFGSAVVAQTLVLTPGEENVTVKVAK